MRRLRHAFRDTPLTDFEIVKAQYPRKTAMSVARKVWNKLNPDTETVQLNG